MKKVQFTLNGKNVCVGGPGPQAQKVIAFIKAIPNGKYFDAGGIAACLKFTVGAVEQTTRKQADEIADNFLIIPNTGAYGRKKVFGSKASIQKLAKELRESGVI